MHNECLKLFEYGYLYPKTFKILGKNVIINNGMHVFSGSNFPFSF
jgi:hypothetical protein